MPAFGLRAIGVLLWLLLPLGQLFAQKATAKTEPPTTYFWGIQRDCELDEPLSRSVQKRLQLMGEYVIPVGNKLVTRSINCLGEDCLRSFQNLCSKRTGTILGGSVAQHQLVTSAGQPATWYLMRLWRIEVGGSKAAYIQHACRKCDIAAALNRLVLELVEHPPSDLLTAKEVQTSRMPFCAPEKAEEVSAPGEQKIAVVVSGVREAKAARAPLLRSIKEHLAQTGREVVRAETTKGKEEGGSSQLQDLSAFVTKKYVNDVLGIELQEEGQVRVRLMNGKTLATAENTIDCLGCGDEALVRRVIMAAAPLLDRCTGPDCRSDMPLTQFRWPESLCQPSAEPSCPAPEGPAINPAEEGVVKSICGGHAEASAPIGPTNIAVGDAGPTTEPPRRQGSRISTGHIIGASLLGAAGLAAFITAGVLTARSGQPAGTGCTSEDGLLMGNCRLPDRTAAYVPTYIGGGALLLSGAVLVLWPLLKHEPPKPAALPR